MNPFTFIKRTIQAVVLLIVAVVMAGSAFVSYVEKDPDARARAEVIGRDAEMRVDEDSTFLEKVSALIASWWDSDELIAEAEQDKALEAESKKKAAEREREAAFNDSQHSSNDDYYGPSE